MSDIVERLRAAPSSALTNWPELTELAADAITTLRAENERMRRWVEHIAKQPLAEQARKDHEDEGNDGEPDFEGGYDAIIEQARELKERVKP